MKTLYGLSISKDGKVYKNGRKINQEKTRNGYLIVRFTLNGKKTYRYCHRLVALLYCKKPKNIKDKCVDHINSIKTDNRSKNLRWVTYKQNFNYARKSGLVSKSAKQRYYPRRALKRNNRIKSLAAYIYRHFVAL